MGEEGRVEQAGIPGEQAEPPGKRAVSLSAKRGRLRTREQSESAISSRLVVRVVVWDEFGMIKAIVVDV